MSPCRIRLARPFKGDGRSGLFYNSGLSAYCVVSTKLIFLFEACILKES